LKTLDNFIEKLKIEKGSVLLLTENSLTLLMAMKKTDEISQYSIDELFDILLDKLIEKLGDKGTLLIQTFDWRFCNSKTYDINNSISRTSFLGNIALKRDDFIRTKHPIYSFAVTGKYKDDLANLDNRGAFDINSPFHFIYKKKAKMIIIDISIQKSFTFVHFVEEMEQVSYRYNKSFTSQYINDKGIENTKTYDMYVRDIENNVLAYFEPLENLFTKNDAMKKYMMDELVIREVDLYKAYNIIENDIRNNNAKSLYKIGENN
jgi:aminoglycoside 3-N-acetyltransferase